jgi:hypothetical protein
VASDGYDAAVVNNIIYRVGSGGAAARRGGGLYERRWGAGAGAGAGCCARIRKIIVMSEIYFEVGGRTYMCYNFGLD